ncbi:MAG: DUF1549 and DUF1553 domain-containing protein [Planctomycetaceae bacterium]
MVTSRALRAGCLLAWGLLCTDQVRSDEAASVEDDLRRIVAVIDGHLESQWRADSVTPSEPADDAEFLRRATLDLNGWIPNVMEARQFLADDSPDKRRQLVDRLLDDPRYAVNFTNYWRRILIPEAESDLMARYQVPVFEGWLRSRLLANRSYRDMVREILEVNVSANSMYEYNNVSPVAYYATKEIKPENLAAATSRMFLGVRLECAQCHDHPFDHWTRRDFWGYSAFFAGLQRSNAGPQGLLAQLRELLGQRNVQIPDTNEFVEPTFLGGKPLGRDTLLSPRQTLANWIVSDENPYFARMAVNRMWGHFFGVGFVDPIDDFNDQHPPSHPELLDALAQELAHQNYDLKFLMRAITRSRAYNLSSRQTDPSQADSRQFARMAVKGLSSNQVYDSFVQATGCFEPFALVNPYVFGRQDTPRQRLAELFADQGTTPMDRPTTILQSLAVMNGDFVSRETQLDDSRLLRSVAEFPGFTTADRVDAIFLSALTRAPTPVEREKFVAYIDAGGANGDSRQALADVFWVLLNGSEFLYNH